MPETTEILSQHKMRSRQCKEKRRPGVSQFDAGPPTIDFNIVYRPTNSVEIGVGGGGERSNIYIRLSNHPCLVIGMKMKPFCHQNEMDCARNSNVFSRLSFSSEADGLAAPSGS
jgi:hypothetical protein